MSHCHHSPTLTDDARCRWCHQQFPTPWRLKPGEYHTHQTSTHTHSIGGPSEISMEKIADAMDHMEQMTKQLGRTGVTVEEAAKAFQEMGAAGRPIFVRGGHADPWDLENVPVSAEVAEEIEKHIRTQEENRVSTLYVEGGTVNYSTRPRINDKVNLGASPFRWCRDRVTIVWHRVTSWSVAVCSWTRGYGGRKRFALLSVVGTEGRTGQPVTFKVAKLNEPTVVEPSEVVQR